MGQNGCGSGSATGTVVFGADGEIDQSRSSAASELFWQQPCPIEDLNGSWLFEVLPRLPVFFAPRVRGPLRIEVGPSALRCSGDVYTFRPSLTNFGGMFGEPVPVAPVPDPVFGPEPPTGGSDAADGNVIFPGSQAWYPSFPKEQYSWYFRSNGASYANGTLTVAVVRHLWNRATQEFVSTDTGTLVLQCRRGIIGLPFRPQELHGTLTLGGTTSIVKATKTSPMYRGCRVEVDAMVNRSFPASATIGSGAVATFRAIYASSGWDVTVTTDETSIPEDASLTNAELATLLTGHRQTFTGEDWRLWLLVGSSQGTLFGIMFDDDAVPREGAAGFADVRLSNDTVIEASARNQPLNNVPAAFLRTLVHEAGHAFNLFHPKHDVHSPPIGIEIMNQTGDVIGFATAANPYPGNAAFGFAEHDRLSLIHSPDPQVRPGWKNFGWGHGSLSSGLPTPVDVAGLSTGSADEGLTLTLRPPQQAFVGEYITAEVVVTNTGAQPRAVTGLLTLAEGDLVVLRTTPQGTLDHVLDIAIGCGPRPMVQLDPGQSLSNHVQVFFTNQGVTFDTPGRHTLVAQLEVDPVTTLYSAPVTIDVRTPASDVEVDISGKTLSDGVGRALALGDFANDGAARGVLTELAESHTDTDTGAASALVLANALSRSFTDFTNDTTRGPAAAESQRFLELAVSGRSAQRALELAVTVASPTEKDAPVVADTLALVRREAETSRPPGVDDTGGPESADLARAVQVAENFVQAQAR
jgi:hypothetical protein